MEFNWIATCVTAVVGLIGTLYVARTADRRATERDNRQQAIDAERDAAERARARRDLERSSVLDIRDEFAAVRGTVSRLSEWHDQQQPDFGEEFPASWSETFSRLNDQVQIVSDKEIRTALQTVITTVGYCGGLETKQMPADTIASDASNLGSTIIGFWLRDEELDDSTRKQIAKLATAIEEFDREWDADHHDLPE